MMENALYYTLSTIAQTLAGALAVLVAFVVFWLSTVDADIRKARSFLNSRLTNRDPATLWTELAEKGVQALDALIEARTAQKLGNWAHPTEQLDLATAYEGYQKRRRVTRRLYVALGCSRLATISLLSVAVVLALTCLGLYVGLILALVRP